MAAEKRIAWVRFAVIVFNVVAYYFLLPDGQGIPWLAATISVIALVYGVFVVAFQPYRWLPIMRAALFTALTDGGLIVLWVWASGGVGSPFHLLWFLSLVAVAFRYEWKATLIATALYISTYVALVVGLGQLPGNAVDLLVRCIYILLAGTLGALLAYDSAKVFEARAHLQDEVDEERRQAQAHELERLRELDRFKSEFINAAAHELNTPLTPLKVQVHLLERQQTAEGRQRSIAVLRRSADRLSSLVQNMLDVARLQSGHLVVRRQETDLSALVRIAVDSYRPLAELKGIALRCDAPSGQPAFVDADRVSQILDNLLANAIKFTGAGGTIVCVVRPVGDDVHVSVQDNGVGFSSEQQVGMFRPFSRLHTDIIREPGTGLGLFISRGLAERHGGRLEAHSDGPGLGARFTCVLPLTAQP